MNESDEGEHIREVYARFGLAVYFAQVLEHGLVNALVILDLIPSRRHLMRSKEEWALAVDSFIDRRFESTMGQLMKALQDVTTVPTDLEGILREALKQRNWLVHSFFRERADEFMSFSGRTQMLLELDTCRACFEEADNRLNEVLRPLRTKVGITDEVIKHEYQRIVQSAKHRG